LQPLDHARDPAESARATRPLHDALPISLAREIDRALAFIRACGMTDDEALRTVTLYCSHEALALEYDRALTRVVGGRAYCLSGQDRKSTRLNSSHVKSSYAVFCSTKKRA